VELWTRLSFLEVGWTGLGALVFAFLVALALRRALPEDRRHRGRVSLVLLGAAPLVHLFATGVALLGGARAAAALHLVNLTAVIFATAGLLGMLVFDVILGRTRVPTILRDFAQTTAFGVIVIVILRSAGVDSVSALTGSAVAAAVLGLASQGILSNVFAGIVLQVDRTLRLGDVIQWGQRQGTIAEIRWRSSSILTREGDIAIVPNAVLLSNEVLNLSRPARKRKVTVRVPFDRRHAPAEVREAMLAALKDVDGVAFEPGPTCSPMDFDHGDVAYAVVFWIEDVDKQGAIEGAVREHIWYAAQRAGLSGPCA
jgi:small-conductance mechanosensitive channel